MDGKYVIQKMRELSCSTDPIDQYAALLFAVQIPGICSRIDIPASAENTGKDVQDAKIFYDKNGKPLDKKLYIAWMKKFEHQFTPYFYTLMPFDLFCEYVYSLRNHIVHSGSLFEINSDIMLVDGDVNGLFTGTRLYMSVCKFCEMMFSAADSSKALGSYCTFTCGSFAEPDKFVPYAIPKDKYDLILKDAYSAFDAFWANRPEKDHDLYVDVYCMAFHGDFEDLKNYLSIRPIRPISTFGGYSRSDMEHLVDVVSDVNTFSRKFDDAIANKYFVNGLFS